MIELLTIGKVLFTKKDQVRTAAMDDLISESCAILAEARIGILVITTSTGLVRGVLSERDIVQAVAEERPLESLRVQDICTQSPVTCSPDETVVDVMDKMHRHGFRHMPVVDHAHLIGVVSIGDLFRYLFEEAELDIISQRWSELDKYL